MRVVSLKMNSNVYPLKNTISHHLLLNITVIPLHKSKISQNFCEDTNGFGLTPTLVLMAVFRAGFKLA